MLRATACALLAVAAVAEPVTLHWKDVAASVSTKKGRRHLIAGASGVAAAGRVLAILGPSGSGKTSLLNALSGQLDQTKGLKLTGELLCNGARCFDAGGAPTGALPTVGFVKQDDLLFGSMTVRETLDFAATLRVRPDAAGAGAGAAVDAVLQTLGLEECAGTRVGDGGARGISGGERKRLSIAVEMLGDPEVLFLDEPTSGLDSFQAERVVKACAALAAQGRTVVMTVHQPSAAVFAQLDDVVLLASGGVPCFGGPREALAGHLKRALCPVPGGASLAEHALECVSVDNESATAAAESHLRVASVAALFPECAAPRAAAAAVAAAGPAVAMARSSRRRPVAGLFKQSRLLLSRAWREAMRSKAALAIKVVQQVGVAVIYGCIYNLDKSQQSIMDRFGLLSLVIIGSVNLAVATTVRAFPKEKQIVGRERVKKLYGMLPYFLSKIAAEAPVAAALSGLFGAILYPSVGLSSGKGKFANFMALSTLNSFAASALGLLLGALAPDSDAAMALFPPLVVLMVIFNGSNIAEESTPRLLRWLPKVSLMRWGFEALAVNEFKDLSFDCRKGYRGPQAATGAEALARFSLEKATVRRAAVAHGVVLAGLYSATYAKLATSSPRFAPMRAPPAAYAMPTL